MSVSARKPAFVAGGFTLIELMVGISIILILLTIAFASYRVFSSQVDLNTSSQKIISVLELARNKTLASESETAHGVHFQTDKFVLFEGATYSAVDPNNGEYVLGTAEIYEINIAGGPDVVFDRIRGTTSNSGNIKIRLINDTTRSETILINSQGQVSLEESVNPTDTRATDTRHLHFNLGWSIRNYDTLRFDFFDDGVVENVPMTGFFNTGKTEFDWEGDIDVNGTNQTLRVHTHLLNATDTTLSVHRNREKNDKSMEIIFIDTDPDPDVVRDVVSYTSVGVATVGSFGGTMTVQ